LDKRKREITGSFYTPQIWVELSQKYLSDVLGESWQEEYFIWDCALVRCFSPDKKRAVR